MDLASARDGSNGVWIRRFIVVALLMFVGFILVAPVLFGVSTNVPVEVTEGWFLWKETFTEYIKLDGMVVPDWLRFAILDIISFYFGVSAVSRQR